MNILLALAAGPVAFRGTGLNHENESFIGEFRVHALEGGRALILIYSATLENGTIVHSESTLLGTGPDGRLCLWPVMSELTAILPHTEVMTKVEAGKYTLAIFASGVRDDLSSFREEITIEISAEGSLVYAHAWGLPGGAFQDRSSCRMMPDGAQPLA